MIHFKKIVNNKFLQTLCLSTIIIASTAPISASAESNIELLLKDKDYIEQQKFVDNKIEENNKALEQLDKDFSKAEDDLKNNYEKVVSLNTSSNNKKSAYERGYSEDNAKNSTLKLFDIVLGSESIGDFFKNIDLAKTVIVKQNQSIKNKEIEKDLLVQEQEDLINQYSEISTKRDDIKTENEELIKKQKEIVEEIARKGTIHFNPENLLEVSNASLEDVQAMLKGTALYDLAPAYIESENKYGVNLFFTIALTAHESSWGTSKRAVEDNNLTGFGVFYDNSVGLNSNTKRDNILRTVSWVKQQYLSPGGHYYKGTSIVNVNQSYAKNADGSVNTEWSAGISQIANNLSKKIK